jgi:MFS family permease
MAGSHGSATTSRSPGGGFFYGYVVAAAAAFIMVLVFSVHYSFGVFFLPLLNEFGWTRAMTAGAFSLVWIAQGLLAIVMGGLNDRFGPRLVLTICGALIGTGYLLMSQVGAVWHLYLFYGVIVGAGLGGTFVPLTSTTARWFVARRGLMTGLVTAGVGIGALVGPPITSSLISGYDWRGSYFILGSVVLVGVTLASQLLRKDPAEMGTIPYGADGRVQTSSRSTTHGLALNQALHTRQFWIMVIAFLCYGFSLSAILLHLAPHAADLGISATSAANLIAMIGAASVVGKVWLGSATDRIGNKNVYLIGFALLAASLFGLVPLTQLSTLYLFAMVFGLAYGALAAAHSPLVAWLFGIRQHGLIFGVSFNGWTTGCALGPIFAGYVFDSTGSYQLAFLVCGLLSVVGLVLTTRLTPEALPATASSPAAKLGSVTA